MSLKSPMPVLQRLAGLPARQPIAFELDGLTCQGFEGDTVLTAVLAQGAVLRHSDAGAAPRAGFCLMGACQDCWMNTADGQRLRACSTPLTPGLRLLTRWPA